MKKLGATLLIAALATVIPSGIAHSDEGPTTVSAKGATVVATNEAGLSLAAIDGGTVLDLEASQFQAIKSGRGGVYVVFGWVDDPKGLSWAPSNGGKTGANYLYAPDSEDKDNKGMSKYVAFEGSATASAANGGLIASDGTWSTQLVVPAAQFEAVDREGKTATINCLEVVCGVITIGAHNVSNPNNETFTPIAFVQDPSTVGSSSSTENSEEPTPAASESEEPAVSESSDPEQSSDASATSTAVLQLTQEEDTNLLVRSAPIVLVAVVIVGVVMLVRRKKQ